MYLFQTEEEYDNYPVIFGEYYTNKGFKNSQEPDYTQRHHWAIPINECMIGFKDIPKRVCIMKTKDNEFINCEDVSLTQAKQVIKNVQYIYKKCW